MVSPNHQSLQGQGLENQAGGREDGFQKATSMPEHQPKKESSKLPPGRDRILGYLDDAPQPSHGNEKTPGTNRLLGYLEDASSSSFHNHPNHSDASPTAPRGPQTVSSRRVQAPAGAYSGSAGEGYQRREKVENCGRILAAEIPNGVDGDNNADGSGELEPKATNSETKWWHQKRFIVALFVAFLLAVVATVVPVAVLQSKPSEEYSVEEENPLLSETPPTAERGFHLVPNITNETIQAMEEDLFSPQARAYDLISKDTDWDSFEDWRKQQRFAMACYMYAVGGGWSQYRSYGDHECLWVYRFVACRGENKDEVNFLGYAYANGVNQVAGDLPSEIAFLSNLEGIEITESKVSNLEEALPLEILSTMPYFKELALHDCEVAGSIPSTLGLLSGLSSLDLSRNKLTGTIPEEISKLPSLENFNIEDNPGLEAPLPSGFCSENRTAWISLQTDWCQSAIECCAG